MSFWHDNSMQPLIGSYIFFPGGSMEYMKGHGWKRAENKSVHALMLADVKALKSIKIPSDVELAVTAFMDIYNTASGAFAPALKLFVEGFADIYLLKGLNGSNPLALSWIDVCFPPASGQQGYNS